LFELKTDPVLPYHYIITVALTSITSKDPGKLFLKHGPLSFTNEDVENIRSAAILSQDKLFRTSQGQCLKNFECSQLAGSIRYMQLAANANDCTIHHFSSAFEIQDEWFVNLVDIANISEHNKDLLKKSRMRC